MCAIEFLRAHILKKCLNIREKLTLLQHQVITLKPHSFASKSILQQTLLFYELQTTETPVGVQSS